MSSGHATAIALMNSLELWWSTQELDKIESITVSTVEGERPTMKGDWQQLLMKDGLLFFSGVAISKLPML